MEGRGGRGGQFIRTLVAVDWVARTWAQRWCLAQTSIKETCDPKIVLWIGLLVELLSWVKHLSTQPQQVWVKGELWVMFESQVRREEWFQLSRAWDDAERLGWTIKGGRFMAMTMLMQRCAPCACALASLLARHLGKVKLLALIRSKPCVSRTQRLWHRHCPLPDQLPIPVKPRSRGVCCTRRRGKETGG